MNYLIFADEKWDSPPIGYTRKRLITAFSKQCGGIVFCVDRPSTIIDGLASVIKWMLAKKAVKLSDSLYLLSVFMPFHEKISSKYKLASRLNNYFLDKQISRIIKNISNANDVHAVWLFHPYQIGIYDLYKKARKIYECYDNYSSAYNLKENERRRLADYDKLLSKEADAILVTAKALLNKKLIYKDKTHYNPNGVDYDYYEKSPKDILSIKRPIAGYIGGIDERIDMKLLEYAAKKDENINYLFIGPIKKGIKLYKGRNMVYLGPKAPSQIPGYLKCCDLGIIPYAKYDYLKSVYPTKANEYLACGLPVVATCFSDLSEFNDLVYVANGADDYCTKIKLAINESNNEDKIKERKEMAKKNSWDNRAKYILEILKDK